MDVVAFVSPDAVLFYPESCVVPPVPLDMPRVRAFGGGVLSCPARADPPVCYAPLVTSCGIAVLPTVSSCVK